MCIPAAAVSAVTSGLGIVQGFQQAAFAQQQANIQHQNAQIQANYERQAQVAKHIGDVRAQQAQSLAAQQQIFYNGEAANKAWVAEQTKLNEAKKAAAFKSQEIYAKSIGATGKVLASGATGKSVGLLALDANRQAGFAQAKENATISSAEQAAGVAIESIGLRNQSQNNQVLSSLSAPVEAPMFASMPTGNAPMNLGIPSYNWG
nr:hypothetical protein [uncultured Mediterranean phage uvMED]BAR25549.1 hypothetical protein [uncultured Mediterranean phage uvMED]